MGKCWGFLSLLVLSCVAMIQANHRCGRTPSEYTAPRSNSVGKFRLRINGNPGSYIPDTNYTVFIEGEPYEHNPQRFTEFNLVVESQGSGFDPGKFELRDMAQTKFSENCRNMIKQTTKSYKERVVVQWTAPPSGSGCITFRTTVIVRKDTWYQDDEPLTKVLCEDHQKIFDEQPAVLEECCACSEATYEVTFEALWSRHTHPNNFPQDLFQTRFSKIIGAAHNKEYSLWEYEHLATDGFREVAENGDITALEAELKQQGSNIRTIIRAPGIGHPDATRKTFATFRTTPEHHLMSLVSMIVPSPDWIVGVSKLELCLLNCSWVDRKTLNLYPWDAGTDSGTLYQSSDEPTSPREIIHRISTDEPNTPFYDKNGEPMKPLARLQVVRLNLFDKNCDETARGSGGSEEEGDGDGNGEGDGDEDDKNVCSVTNWSEWTDCEANCEEGSDITGYRSRQRQYKLLWAEKDCNRTLVDIQKCEIENNNCWNPSKCILTNWSDWSSCYNFHSSSCARRVRYRQINGPEDCKNANNKPQLTEFMNCEGHADNCEQDSDKFANSNEDNQDEIPEPINCKWDSSECNVTCGQGYKERKMIRYMAIPGENERENHGQDDILLCDGFPSKVEPCDTGISCKKEQDPTSSFRTMESASQTITKPYYDYNREDISPNPVINCLTSRWTAWSTCSATCGKSFRNRSRNIMVHAQNGGKPCPKKLYKRKRCNVPSCDKIDAGSNESNILPKNGCKYSPWTQWSACTVTCGEGKKQKTRSIIDKAPDAQCDERIKTKTCILPACRQH